MTVFRNSADRLPVAWVAAMTAVDFGLYFLTDNVWLLLGYWLVMIIPKATAGAWAHHHQHVATFNSTALNRLLEMSHGLHTCFGTNLWVLHHNLGHHVNYLDQTKDESRWRRRSGKQMGVFEYTASLVLTAHYRAYKAGARYPKQRRDFVIFTSLMFAIVALLVWYRPMQGVILFLVPMCLTLTSAGWVTYDHHAGLDSKDPHHASFNILNRWFNRLTGNLGYHTAHHQKPGLHWSLLPGLHETIKYKIPRRLFRKTSFDPLFPRATPEAAARSDDLRFRHELEIDQQHSEPLSTAA